MDNTSPSPSFMVTSLYVRGLGRGDTIDSRGLLGEMSHGREKPIVTFQTSSSKTTSSSPMWTIFSSEYSICMCFLAVVAASCTFTSRLQDARLVALGLLAQATAGQLPGVHGVDSRRVVAPGTPKLTTHSPNRQWPRPGWRCRASAGRRPRRCRSRLRVPRPRLGQDVLLPGGQQCHALGGRAGGPARAAEATDLALVQGREHDGLEARVAEPERDADVAPAVPALSGTSGAVVTYRVRGSEGSAIEEAHGHPKNAVERPHGPTAWRAPRQRRSVPCARGPRRHRVPDANHSPDSASACCSTVLVAASCLSGG